MASHLGDEVDPERSTGPWSGHRDFAYDLIRWRQPETVVELGTHYGVSFFSFCQAVIDAGADAELHAVDTWQGDEHAGFYDESVFEKFKESLAAFSGADVKLHRTTFRDALTEFEDESIDLLHIDGFHSYEALRDDFESWLPKVAPGGVVLVHDVNPDSGYGSADYYAERIAPTFPNFAFPHSFGLGVVFPKGTEGWEPLLSDEFEGWRLFYPERAEARLLRIVERDQAKMIEERAALIARYEQQILSQQKALERSRAEIEARDVALHSTTRQLRQARDRVQQLAPLEHSAKAQLKALRHTLPPALANRSRRLARSAARAAKTRVRRPSSGGDEPRKPAPDEPAIATRASLEEILAGLLGGSTGGDRDEVERKLFRGLPLTDAHAARLGAVHSAVAGRDGDLRDPSPEAFLSLNGGEERGALRSLADRVDADLVTVDVWDTLIFRNRPADAAKTATGRRIALLCADGGLADPFEVAATRVEIEAEMAAAAPSEEYELSEVIEATLARLGMPEGAERGALAARLAQREAEDEIRWSYANREAMDLIESRSAPVVLLSDFYMRTDLLQRIVSAVTGLDLPLWVSVDKGVSKRLGGEMFRAVRAEHGVPAERHLHIGDNVYSDIEQQKNGGGVAIRVRRPDRFPAPGRFGPESLAQCWAELDRRIAAELPATDDRFRAAGRAQAPLAVGLVALAHEQAIRAGVDRVHYLSREGAFLAEVHEAVEPILRPDESLVIAAKHLEVSRMSTFAASLERPFKTSLHRMWSMYARQSVVAMLASIGIQPEEVREHLERVELTPETQLADAANDRRVQELLDLPEFDRFLGERVEHLRDLLRDYVVGRTEITDPFLVVDIGWRGTIQDNLVRALDIDRSIGVYFGLFPFLNAQAPGTRKLALAFDGNQGDEYAFAEPPAVLERPWTADVPSTVGYEREGGTVTPIRVKETGAVSEGIRVFQQGTLEAAPLVAEWIAGMGLTGDLLRPGFAERAKRLWGDPPEAVADIWFESDHDDSFGALNQVAFHKLRPDQTWLQGELRKHLAKGEKLSGWPSGYRAWAPVRGVIELAALWQEGE